MAKVIDSIEVIHAQGPIGFWIGTNCGTGIIADIIEDRGAYRFYDEADNLLMEVINCPVIIRYREEE